MKTGLRTIGDYIGQQFGFLVVDRLVGGVSPKRRPFAIYGHAPVVCRCCCGNECVVTINRLIGGKMHCGCGGKRDDTPAIH